MKCYFASTNKKAHNPVFKSRATEVVTQVNMLQPDDLTLPTLNPTALGFSFSYILSALSHTLKANYLLCESCVYTGK